MRICDFAEKNVGIWGLGREGWSVLKVLQNVSLKSLVILNDTEIAADQLQLLQDYGDCEICVGQQNIASRILTLDVVIKSPGVSSYRPEIVEAKNQGVAFTSATQIWFAENPEKTTICVTGTKGKSTTTSLLVHLLKALGHKVAIAGNIGYPILDIQDHADIWVVELSSYQTSDFQATATLAILLNLYPEHLDWHKNTENYFRDKLQLIRHAQNVVLNAQDENTRKYVGQLPVQPHYFNQSSAIHCRNDGIYCGEKLLVAFEEISLPGKHNHCNICAVLTALQCLNFDISQAIPALGNFIGLPHRLYCLGEFQEVRYVDDSISTTPQSTMAAIEAYHDFPITILLGGQDRGLDWQFLANHLVDRVANVITMPQSGERVADFLEPILQNTTSQTKLFRAQNLAEAVAIAKQHTAPGGVVLLSPASPSYGYFRNFEERGRKFAELVGFAR